ncbi:phosphatase PAP2 family protein [bacterium]|nr:MAG: phosphatase PAP2 family protein [bacterium]
MTRRLILFLLSIAACFAAPRVPWIVAWDQGAIQSVAFLRNEAWNDFFRVVTDIGSTYGFLVALILPAVYFLLRRRFATAAWYFAGVGLLKLSGPLLKIAIARPRPPDGIETLKTFSMPSGHASNAVFIFGVLWVFLWRRFPGFWPRVFSSAFCLMAIFLIDFSRVYLGVHYPSDVVLGSLYIAAGLSVLSSLRRDIFRL